MRKKMAVAFITCVFLSVLVASFPVLAAKKGRTTYAGIDYSAVYSYSYYLKKHPKLKKKYGNNDKAVLKYYIKHGYPKQEKARKKVAKNAFDSIAKQRFAKALRKTKTAEKTDQIILVVDHQLSLWNKKADGTWKRALKTYCGYGRNGFSSDRHEGDGTTPVGSFPILFSFGSADDPGAKMEWRDITPYSYWSGEKRTYNTWVESRSYMAGEHLMDYYQYAYAMALGFNSDPVVYKKGSAIFLHCKSYDRWHTAGCVSVKKSVMKKLVRKCHEGAYILIVPKENKIAKY